MFSWDNFWDKSPSGSLKIFEMALKIFKNALGQFIPNCPPKHVTTSTDN